MRHWLERQRSLILFTVLGLAAVLSYLLIRPWQPPRAEAISQGNVSLGTEVWLGTRSGAYRIVEGNPVRVLDGQFINTIAEVGGEVWLGTDNGAYRVASGNPTLVLGGVVVQGLRAFHLVDSPWMRLATGAARYLFAFLFVGLIVARGFQRFISWRQLQRRRISLAFEVEQAKMQMEGLFPPAGTFERRGIHLAHRRIQATSISGDFYNFITRGDGSLGIYFVDVEGQVISAIRISRGSKSWPSTLPYTAWWPIAIPL